MSIAMDTQLHINCYTPCIYKTTSVPISVLLSQNAQSYPLATGLVREISTRRLFSQLPGILYGVETVSMVSSHTKTMEVIEMKMCRWACDHTIRDHVRNYNMSYRLKVENGAKNREVQKSKTVVIWKRRDKKYVERKILDMVPPVGRKGEDGISDGLLVSTET